jgi:hypothetical protein
MTDAPLDASPDMRNASPFTFDPDDPLAGIRKFEHVDEDKRVGEVAQAVRAMGAAGVLDAVTEEIVRDYVTRRKLLSKSAFRAIVRESRPSHRTVLPHLHTRSCLRRHPQATGAAGDGCEAPPPAWAKGPDILGRLVELPRVFRTGNLRLNHAASCPLRYSSRTSCGVL